VRRPTSAAAERFLAKALRGENHPAPRVINTDKHASYSPAIVELKAGGVLDENSKHRPVHYLNSVRRDELKCRSFTPAFGSTTKLQHIREADSRVHFAVAGQSL
jgi:transposase-like protein